ncbi:hypothetical protein KC953_00320 [Candidatus Saccharibacteria bacterium]|nr:hypothetical protein [Candidatus Saccharibacteria bacterium]
MPRSSEIPQASSPSKESNDPIYFENWVHDYEDERNFYPNHDASRWQGGYDPITETTNQNTTDVVANTHADESDNRNHDTEAIQSTINAQEALDCYHYRYPEAARTVGMVRAQDALSMIIQIYNKYHAVATNEELAFIDHEVITTVHEIGNLSDSDSPDTSPDLGDPYKLIYAIEILESTNAPIEAIHAAEDDLRKVIARTEKYKGNNFLKILKGAIEEHDDPNNHLHLQELVSRFQAMDVSRRQYQVEIKAKNNPEVFRSLSGDDSSNPDASRIINNNKDIAA